MSKVMFATLCDICGARSEEYASWPTCIECLHDICPKCDISDERTDGETNETWCKTCAWIDR